MPLQNCGCSWPARKNHISSFAKWPLLGWRLKTEVQTSREGFARCQLSKLSMQDLLVMYRDRHGPFSQKSCMALHCSQVPSTHEHCNRAIGIKKNLSDSALGMRFSLAFPECNATRPHYEYQSQATHPVQSSDAGNLHLSCHPLLVAKHTLPERFLSRCYLEFDLRL